MTIIQLELRWLQREIVRIQDQAKKHKLRLEQGISA